MTTMLSKISVLAILVLAAASVIARADEAVDAMIKRADAAPTGERPSLDIEIAELELRNADRLYAAGDVTAARAAVDNVVKYSGAASDATTQARGKIKGTEIAIRKMAAKLRDIKRSLAYEDQPPVQSAADQLEKLRTGLLARMFSKN